MSNDLGEKTMERHDADVGILPKKINKSRRTFAAKGIIAPVVLSLANRPAWGASFRCTVSGFDSLATIGSGPAMADIEAMCDYMSVNEVYNNMGVDVDAKVEDIFPLCAGLVTPVDLTVGDALLGGPGVGEITTRLVAAYYNEILAVRPFGVKSAEEVYCHILNEGLMTPFAFEGVILNGMEIHNFLGYVGIK